MPPRLRRQTRYGAPRWVSAPRPVADCASGLVRCGPARRERQSFAGNALARRIFRRHFPSPFNRARLPISSICCSPASTVKLRSVRRSRGSEFSSPRSPRRRVGRLAAGARLRARRRVRARSGGGRAAKGSQSRGGARPYGGRGRGGGRGGGDKGGFLPPTITCCGRKELGLASFEDIGKKRVPLTRAAARRAGSLPACDAGRHLRRGRLWPRATSSPGAARCANTARIRRRRTLPAERVPRAPAKADHPQRRRCRAVFRWPIFVRADLPDQRVTQICAALQGKTRSSPAGGEAGNPEARGS